MPRVAHTKSFEIGSSPRYAMAVNHWTICNQMLYDFGGEAIVSVCFI
jgi:hypothetical protein